MQVNVSELGLVTPGGKVKPYLCSHLPWACVCHHADDVHSLVPWLGRLLFSLLGVGGVGKVCTSHQQS